MKRLLLISLLVLCLLPAAAAAVSVTDYYDYVSEITTEPQTIISLAPANTEILFALDLGDKVIGVTEYCNYPEEAKNKPIVSGYSTINIEKIVSQNPDIIFGNTLNGKENVEHLRKLGLTVVCLNPDGIDETFRTIRTIGTATGTEKEAEDLIASMQERIDNVTEKLKAVNADSPTVLHLLGTDPYWISGSTTFQDDLITLAGGKNAFPDVSGWGVVTLERIITTDPDVILVGSGSGMGEDGEDRLKKAIMEDPRFTSLSAVKNDRVYVINSDTFNRGGPRIVDALDDLAAALHPDYFGTTDPTTVPQASGFGTVVTIIAAAFGLLLLRKDR